MSCAGAVLLFAPLFAAPQPSFFLLPLNVAAWDRGAVETFATLPAGNANPEGVTVDKHGDVYVTTFAVTASGGPGKESTRSAARSSTQAENVPTP
jgi:hypothetical protein